MLAGAPANFQIFFTQIKTGYELAYQATPLWNLSLALEVPITNEQVVNGWLGMMPRAREWIGKRIVHTPQPETFLVKVKNFELTWGEDRFKLDDDKLNFNLYAPWVRQHGMMDAKEADYSLRDLIFNTGSWSGVLGTDGLAIWSAVHPVDVYDSSAGTYCNDFRGGVSVDGRTVGGALTHSSFKSVYDVASVRKMQNGEAGMTTPNVMLASTLLRGEAELVLKNQFAAPAAFGGMGTGVVGSGNAPFVGAVNNPTMGWVDLTLIEDWAKTSAYGLMWVLAKTNGPVKPFTLFRRQAAVTVPRVAETDPSVFDSHLYQFGSYQRLAVAPGLPFLSSISGPTAV